MPSHTDSDKAAPIQPALIALTTPDLTEALDFFTSRLGFRVEMIVPADDPKSAVISGQGLTLRLVANEKNTVFPASDIESPAHTREIIVSRCSAEDAWKTGRAGMMYRDLIPGRLGGRVIASHIRIPGGGETPDYVHYHKVRFQMIYCKAGWVRVVYEDQGPPFVLEPGDCVLQPPQIRHRVLESSPGLEVIEIGSPAVHETWADHKLQLPTDQVLPDRIFSGQRFVRHCARRSQWEPWRLSGFEARDTGAHAATNGLADVRIVRTESTTSANADRHDRELLFLFVLQGELETGVCTQGDHLLQSGDCCVIPAGLDYTLRANAGLEMLEVSLSALKK